MYLPCLLKLHTNQGTARWASKWTLALLDTDYLNTQSTGPGAISTQKGICWMSISCVLISIRWEYKRDQRLGSYPCRIDKAWWVLPGKLKIKDSWGLELWCTFVFRVAEIGRFHEGHWRLSLQLAGKATQLYGTLRKPQLHMLLSVGRLSAHSQDVINTTSPT